MKKKILVLCPKPSMRGGVSFYYLLVKKHFASNAIYLDYYYTGAYDKQSYAQKIMKGVLDIAAVIKILHSFDVVILNPSLDPKALIRDGVYNLIAKRIFRKKTVIFFHGWNIKFERLINKYGKKIFNFIFSSDRTFVLASRFKQTLVAWGLDPNLIFLETTVFEHHEFNIKKDPFKLLFLSRFVKGKGCLEVIQTVELLAKGFPGIKLFMAGDGEMSYELQDYAIEHNLKNYVEFTGWIEGKEKYFLLEQCGIMLYPTQYGDGMPICILEGMGMGLAIITRPVAGITDVVVNGENGFLIESLDPEDFAAKVGFLLLNRDIWQAISERNREAAKKRFEIKNVIKRLENVYVEIANKV